MRLFESGGQRAEPPGVLAIEVEELGLSAWEDGNGRKAWLVEIRPADDPEGSGFRRRLVLAGDERAALRQVLGELERPDDDPELLIDGQEEVFARSELTENGPEHQARAGGKPPVGT